MGISRCTRSSSDCENAERVSRRMSASRFIVRRVSYSETTRSYEATVSPPTTSSAMATWFFPCFFAQ